MKKEFYFKCPHCAENLEHDFDLDSDVKWYCKYCEGHIIPSQVTPIEIEPEEGNYEFN